MQLRLTSSPKGETRGAVPRASIGSHLSPLQGITPSGGAAENGAGGRWYMT